MNGPAAEKKKVVAYAIPMMGHVNPVLRLCTALASRGHEVTFSTSAALAPKLANTCSGSRFSFHGLEDGLTEEKLKTPDAAKNPRFEEMSQLHTPLLTALVDTLNPSLVLSDFASGAGFASARAKNVPLVINMAVPATAVQAFFKLQNLAILFLAKTIKPDETEMLEFMSRNTGVAMQRTLSIVNDCTALGADEPLPPNFFLSGSLETFQVKPLQESKHADLLAWLSKARAATKPIFYITTGSLLDLTEQQVLALYEGFAACDVWVIWSLKQEKQSLLPELPEKFFVSGWMPQIEILGLEDLSAVLTHCGWGGTLECMGAGKPVICYPGFGDQMMNAKILHGKGCGPMLNPARAGARQIRNAVQDVVDNLGSYQCKAKDVSEQLKKAPGPLAAVKLMEQISEEGPLLAQLVQGKPYHLLTEEELTEHGPGLGAMGCPRRQRQRLF